MPKDNLLQTLDQLVRQAGEDPGSLPGKRVREIMHTGLKLVRDQADDGELKLISRSVKELRYALKVFRPYQHTRKITIFGSARTPPGHPTYEAALSFSRLMADAGWMVITGAGNGIMRAGHGGAGREASFGVSIRLPFETNANEYIVGDPKLVNFRYFFTRKLIFIWQAHAVALFPGGFGTQDEGFEALTLIQTGKAPLVPIVLIDRERGHYWKNWDAYVRSELLSQNLISPDDLNLYTLVQTPDEAVRRVLAFYRNYHSQRFVQDLLILRMQRPLTDEQVGTLGEQFHDLVEHGRIQQGGPESAETQNLHLPRLKFVFTRRSYGRLRLLIDRVNALDAENHPDQDRTGDAGPPSEDLADQTASV